MSRKILFRAKRKDTGQLIYAESGSKGIVFQDEIIPDTLSQTTGLTDKNDKEIFEGDHIRFYYKGDWVVCQVVFIESDACFGIKWKDGYLNPMLPNPKKYEIVEE